MSLLCEFEADLYVANGRYGMAGEACCMSL